MPCESDRPQRKGLLQPVQCCEERLERPTRQRLMGRLTLTALEGIQPALLVNPLGLIGKQHGITIEGNTQLTAVSPATTTGEDGRRSKPGRQRVAHILGMGR